jgi:signal transduction histidine kinase
MRSLWLKLLSAFIGVILLSAGLNQWLVSRATSGQFSRFIVASGQAWVQQTALILTDHYERTGSWRDVDSLLRTPWIGMMGMTLAPAAGPLPTQVPAASTPPVAASVAASTVDVPQAQNPSPWMREGMMGHGGDDWMEHGQRNGPPATPEHAMWNDRWMGRMTDGGMMDGGMMDGGMMEEEMTAWGALEGNVWRGLGLRLLLADREGKVIADTESDLTGTLLTPSEMAAGVPITVENQAVGTLLAVSALASAPSPAADYMRTVNRSTWLASAVVSALALVIGLLLFRQIVAPVRAVTGAAQRIAAGDLTQRVPVTTQDEIGQLARSFNQMADALALDRQLRRHMIADIAHELRTPVSVIQANLEAMLDGVMEIKPQEIASLNEEAMLLARLISDLRMLSLAEAGQLKLVCRPTDLGALADRVIEHLHVQAEANQVSLTAEVATNLPRVAADPDRLGQVLSNLLSNALHHTPPGGRITVCAHTQPADHGASAVVVQVADTGTGIDSADLPFVFDRFYRADKSRSRSSGGSGIGLALVKQLVEAHGGRVWVESHTGQGATFSFALPLT